MNHPQSVLQRHAARAVLGSWLTSALALLAVALPKCPLCVAAYLCVFGFSASSAAAVIKLGVPLCVALIAGSALGTAWFVARRGRQLSARTASKHACCDSAR